mgnify:FL=1
MKSVNPARLMAYGVQPQRLDDDDLRVSLGLQHLAATVETGGADVVTQVHFAGGGLNGGTWSGQRVVRTVHATLGGRFFVLLNGHDGLRKPGPRPVGCQTTPLPANSIP